MCCAMLLLTDSAYFTQHLTRNTKISIFITCEPFILVAVGQMKGAGVFRASYPEFEPFEILVLFSLLGEILNNETELCNIFFLFLNS